jgi:hypothetical protein
VELEEGKKDMKERKERKVGIKRERKIRRGKERKATESKKDRILFESEKWETQNGIIRNRVERHTFRQKQIKDRNGDRKRKRQTHING